VNDRERPLAVLLAATAEAGVGAMVVHVVLEGAGVIGLGLAAFLPLFCVVFAGASALTWRARDSELAGPTCVIAAVLVGLALGQGTMQSTVVSVLVCVGVAFRIATLGLHDWRDPDDASLWIGGIVAGLEALAAGSIQRSWGLAMVVVVPLFFAASLASRAAVVWRDQRTTATSPWRQRSGMLAAGLGGIAVAALLLGGTIDRLATWVAPVGHAALEMLVWGISQLARPLIWAVGKAGVDTEGARELLDQIRGSTREATRVALDRGDPRGGGGGLARVVALLFLVAFAAIAIRLFRRLRATPSRAISPLDAPVDASTSPVHDDGTPTEERERRGRRLPPADAVRRAYADVLDALDSSGLPKPPNATPAEFALEVASQHPSVAEDFSDLTRAYEAVRYGAEVLAEGSLEIVERDRRSILGATKLLPPPRGA
jgi:hypothetical protein